MRYLFLILSLVSSLLSFEWPDDYEAALKQAKIEKKNVYIFVGTANCPFCQKLKDKTFSDKELMSKIKKEYVIAYLSKDIDDIPSHLDIKFYPAHYFLSADGDIIYSTAGYRGKKCFLELLKEVKDFN